MLSHRSTAYVPQVRNREGKRHVETSAPMSHSIRRCSCEDRFRYPGRFERSHSEAESGRWREKEEGGRQARALIKCEGQRLQTGSPD